MNSQNLNIFTTIDARWVPYACMMIRSVRDHYAGGLCYWIVHDDIPPSTQEKVRQWGCRELIDVRFVNFTELAQAEPTRFLTELGSLTSGPWTSGYSSGVNFGRYCARYFLPDHVRRAIYADVDMIAVSDISSLGAIDLQGQAVGAVRCPAPLAAQAIGVRVEEYFNNGLLVFDLDVFDERNCLRRMSEALLQDGLHFGPQCAFSFAMQGNISRLDDVWNVQGELRALVGSSAKLVHFTGPTKPWHALSVDTLRPQVKSIIESTPFPLAWQPDLTLRKKVRILARQFRGLIAT